MWELGKIGFLGLPVLLLIECDRESGGMISEWGGTETDLSGFGAIFIPIDS